MISVLFCMSMIVDGLSDFYGNNAYPYSFNLGLIRCSLSICFKKSIANGSGYAPIVSLPGVYSDCIKIDLYHFYSKIVLNSSETV